MANESKKTCLCLSTVRGCNRMEQDVWRSTSIRQAGIECTWWSWWYHDGTIWNKCCFFIIFLLYRFQRSLFLQRWSQVLLRICCYEHLSNHQVKVVSQWNKKHASPIASTKWLQFWTQLPVTNSTNVLEMISPQSFPTGAWSMPSLGCGQCLVQVLRISVTKFQTCQSVTRIPEQMEGTLM